MITGKDELPHLPQARLIFRAGGGDRGLVCTSDEVLGISLGEDKDPCSFCAGSFRLLQGLGVGGKSGSLVGGCRATVTMSPESITMMVEMG